MGRMVYDGASVNDNDEVRSRRATAYPTELWNLAIVCRMGGWAPGKYIKVSLASDRIWVRQYKKEKVVDVDRLTRRLS